MVLPEQRQHTSAFEDAVRQALEQLNSAHIAEQGFGTLEVADTGVFHWTTMGIRGQWQITNRPSEELQPVLIELILY